MKRKILPLLFSLPFLLFSCIKKEARNAEADIIDCSLPADIALKTDPIITNTDVTIYILPDQNKKKLSPQFVITEGATILPDSGTERDFTIPQQYSVTSEDGHWTKIYTVSVIDTEIPTKFDFENWEIDGVGDYTKFYEKVTGPTGNIDDQYIWSSGNGGFAIVAPRERDHTIFPTDYTTDSYSGNYAARLETLLTGENGAKAGMPMAAGNLFIGTFNAANAMNSALKSTKFGLPFNKKPLKFRGYYKYKAGEEFLVDLKPDPTRKDSCAIYAVLYEPDDKNKTLDGTNSETSDRIVAAAFCRGLKNTDEYLEFEADFDYDSFALSFDENKLKSFRYNLTVIFSSSWDGANFRGALGSTLYIDEVEVICEEEIE